VGSDGLAASRAPRQRGIGPRRPPLTPRRTHTAADSDMEVDRPTEWRLDRDQQPGWPGARSARWPRSGTCPSGQNEASSKSRDYCPTAMPAWKPRYRSPSRFRLPTPSFYTQTCRASRAKCRAPGKCQYARKKNVTEARCGELPRRVTDGAEAPWTASSPRTLTKVPNGDRACRAGLQLIDAGGHYGAPWLQVCRGTH
jgi:hypothetical protein